MARDARDGRGIVVRDLHAKIAADLGFLVVFLEQRALDRLGLVQPRVGVDFLAGLPRGDERQRRRKERIRLSN